ncbi:MAG TPA: TetR family transcriptional regulator [Polyangiaceae bacterium]
MKRAKKQTRNPALTQKRILDAAEAEFAAKGFDGARLGTIARAAGVQQALIHHYFDDKARLYREVIDRALSGMTTEGWDILARTVRSVSAHGGTRWTEADLRPLVSAFVELLQRFFTAHRAMLAIVQGETRGAQKTKNNVALELVRLRVKPVADATTAYVDALRASGEIRSDVDPQKLCTSAISMVAFPLLESSFVSAVWPVDPSNKRWLDAQREDIVETLVRRILP